MHCIKCGNELSPSQTSCPICGAPNGVLDETSAQDASTSQYTSPTYEISNKDKPFDSANKRYKNVNQFYRPHNLPHSTRSGNRKRRRKKSRSGLLLVVLPIVTIAFSFVAVCAALKFNSIVNRNLNIRGSWVATDTSNKSEGAIYLFANDGFVTVKDSEYAQTSTKYCWKVEGDKLIVDGTIYHWNTDLNQYSNKDQEHWCVSGTTIYISNTSDDGYKILNKALD